MSPGRGPTAIPGQARAPAGPPALELYGVSKSFRSGRRRIEALRGVDLRVHRDRVTGLIGPDGSGKTTLMRLAAGLLIPDEGRVNVLGLDASREPLSVQATVGYMPQRFGLYEDLTVQENLDLYADLQGVPLDSRSERYRELLHMTGLGPFTRRLAGKLSGGMKQKLGLACTLIRPPELLLLDEPTVGVDPVSRRELWQIVYRFVREEGTSVLVSTAYLDEAERCSEIIILHEGKLLGYGPPHIFSDRLKGRTYEVLVDQLKNREVQQRIASASRVVDAVIERDSVRVVLRDTAPPELDQLLPGIEGARISPTPPRFEDAFVSMLGQRGEKKPPLLQKPQGQTVSRADPEAARTVIEVQDLERRFGDFYAVKGVSFEVSRGEVFGLLGANGAGKTTTFRMLCGLLPVSAGSLRVAGVDLRRAPARARARIGYMSQKFSLYAALTVAQNLRFFSSAYGLLGHRRSERIDWAIDHFNLGSVRNMESGELSLGYKQRLAFACALMHEPEILFLDEPTSGVDPLARREFWHRIGSLAEQGVTVLVTTHFMEEAEYCDRIAILVAGELLALGTPSIIKREARTAENQDPTMEEAFIGLIESHPGKS